MVRLLLERDPSLYFSVSAKTRDPRPGEVQGRDVILELDVQGARTVRERVRGAVLVFITPPTREELERRLRARGTEDPADLERRLAAADWEMAQRDWFDHVVENDDLSRAAREVADIIDSYRRQQAGDKGDDRSQDRRPP